MYTTTFSFPFCSEDHSGYLDGVKISFIASTDDSNFLGKQEPYCKASDKANIFVFSSWTHYFYHISNSDGLC